MNQDVNSPVEEVKQHGDTWHNLQNSGNLKDQSYKMRSVRDYQNEIDKINSQNSYKDSKILSLKNKVRQLKKVNKESLNKVKELDEKVRNLEAQNDTIISQNSRLENKIIDLQKLIRTHFKGSRSEFSIPSGVSRDLNRSSGRFGLTLPIPTDRSSDSTLGIKSGISDNVMTGMLSKQALSDSFWNDLLSSKRKNCKTMP